MIDIIDDLDALKALTTRPAVVEMLGYSSPGDGGGGFFRWVPGSLETPDDGIVVECTAGASGRYIRLIYGGICPEWFGVVGGVGAGDSADAWEDTIAAAVQRELPITPLPRHTSGITRTLSLSAGLFAYGARLIGDGSQTIFVLELSPGVARTCGVFFYDGDGANSDGINYTMLGARPPLPSQPWFRGLSQFQQVTAAWMEAPNVGVQNAIITNFGTAICLRGPVVVNPAGARGYDWSSTYPGLVIRNVTGDGCDFTITGSQYRDVLLDNFKLFNGTYTYDSVPPHWIYLQNVGGSGVRASGSFIVTGGTSSPGVNVLANLTVNGVAIIGSPVDWTTSNDVTAALIAIAINASTSAPDYYATAAGSTVSIFPYEIGDDYNGFVVAPTLGGTLTGSSENMADGEDNTYGGFVEDVTVTNINCLSYNILNGEEAFKFSNIKRARISIQANDVLGGITLSDAFDCVVEAPNITNIANGGYGVRATATGNNNRVNGGIITAAPGAAIQALLPRDNSYNFGASDTVIITDIAGGSSTFNECRIEDAATAEFSNIVIINKQARASGFYSFGFASGSAARAKIVNPTILNNQGIVRIPAGTAVHLQVDPKLVTNWAPTSTACIRNDGGANALTVTALPTLVGSNAWLFPQSIAVSTADAAALAVSQSGAETAVKITATGSGLALLIGDQLNDPSPIAVDSGGNMVLGATAPLAYASTGARLQVQSTIASQANAALGYWNSNSTGPSVILGKSRGSTVGTHGLLANGDAAGTLLFMGSDGVGFVPLASVRGIVDGTAAASDMPGRLVFATTADGAAAVTDRWQINNTGGLRAQAGWFSRGGPVTKTANFTVVDTENWLINNKSGSSCVVTLPTAADYPGRELMFTNYQAQTLVSATANVVPLGGGAASADILSANVGRWCSLVSDGTRWVITAGTV